MKRLVKPLGAMAAGLTAVFLLAQIGCHKARDPWADTPGGTLKVLVSFAPLYSFTKSVAGDDARVISMLAPTGPHEHRATVDDAQLASGADLFLVNGLELDDFVANVASTSGNKNLKVVKIGDALPEKARIRSGGEEHEGHKHGEWDPHVWLGAEQAILMVQEIRDQLKAADPAHAAGYDQRAASYIEELKKLHAYGKQLLAGKKNRRLIAMHESLAYFCQSYDLELEGSLLPQPGVEADLKRLAELEALCIKNHVHVVAVEPQYKTLDDKLVTPLQKALKAKNHTLAVVEVDPLETAARDQLDAGFYVRAMRRNLDNLAAKLP
jgi:ABC-type Zn uptake system ZnuABC Zn-binding protein ZnuA